MVWYPCSVLNYKFYLYSFTLESYQIYFLFFQGRQRVGLRNSRADGRSQCAAIANSRPPPLPRYIQRILYRSHGEMRKKLFLSKFEVRFKYWYLKSKWLTLNSLPDFRKCRRRWIRNILSQRVEWPDRGWCGVPILRLRNGRGAGALPQCQTQDIFAQDRCTTTGKEYTCIFFCYTYILTNILSSIKYNCRVTFLLKTISKTF